MGRGGAPETALQRPRVGIALMSSDQLRWPVDAYERRSRSLRGEAGVYLVDVETSTKVDETRSPDEGEIQEFSGS